MKTIHVSVIAPNATMIVYWILFCDVYPKYFFFVLGGARCSSMVRAFAHGVMGRCIDPSWGEPIELFLVPASAPRLV